MGVTRNGVKGYPQNVVQYSISRRRRDDEAASTKRINRNSDEKLGSRAEMENR